MNEKYGDACSTHCCKWHGCKYGYYKGNQHSDKLCAVTVGGVKQEYPCEYCSDQWEQYLDFLEIDPEWIEYIQKWENDGGQI